MARQRSTTYELPTGPGADLAHALARNVKAARAARRISQSALAEKAGISWRTLARVEGPEAIADLKTLAQLADALGKSPSTLIRQ